MQPNQAEVDALREVLFTPVESFVTEKERAGKGEEWAEKMAHKRMFADAIKAVDKARGERTMWTVCLGFGPKWIECFGLYATQAQAQKGREQMLAALGNLVVRSSVVALKNEHAWAQMQERSDQPAPVKGDWAEVAADRAAFKNGWNGKAKSRKNFEESA